MEWVSSAEPCLLRRQDFPGGPVVESLPFNAGDSVLSLVWELGSHMLCGAVKRKKDRQGPNIKLD